MEEIRKDRVGAWPSSIGGEGAASGESGGDGRERGSGVCGGDGAAWHGD